MESLIIGIAGGSGSGKSTIARLIASFWEAEKRRRPYWRRGCAEHPSFSDNGACLICITG